MERRKGRIGEAQVCALLRRYSVSTVLAFLREVSQLAGRRIDWDELVRNTATGITSARECQILWRHLAYGESLVKPPGSDAEVEDDDSDLEFEMEPSPAVGREAALEAAACVKVLMASCPSKDADHPSNATIEAPLTINIPNCKAFEAEPLQPNSVPCTNISIPVTLQKQPLGEKRPISGVSPFEPARRKRRPWTTDDDRKLEAAVQRHGERNWAHIASGEFFNDRKASELSQRWANLKKKQADPKVGTSSQTPDLAAARRAFAMALDSPMGDNLKLPVPMSSASAGLKPNFQPLEIPGSQGHQQLARAAAPAKPQTPNMRSTADPGAASDSMVKAAAVAAGARVATPGDAARPQNVVRIPIGASSSKKPSSGASISSQLPKNVHFISNGLAKAPIASYSAAKPSVSAPGEAPQAAAPTTSKSSDQVDDAPLPNSESGSTSVPSTEASPPVSNAEAHVQTASAAQGAESSDDKAEVEN